VTSLLVVVLAVLAMPQPFGPLHPRSHELFLGVPGSGKTHHARARLASARRAVFFDPTGHDYENEGERIAPTDLVSDPELLCGSVVRLVVVPGDDVPADFTATVEAVREAARQLGPLVLCADEVGDYSPSCADVLTRLHRNGHHDGVASVLVSQCAVDIPKTCRRTATRVASLLQTASADLDALETEYGADFRERVQRWRPGDPPAVWTLPTLYPTSRKE
jgi:hypothetical protein